MALIGNKNFNNIAGAGETPIYQRTGGGTGGGNQILAQGRVYDVDGGYPNNSFASDQIGFSGPPQFGSTGAVGYNSSEYYFYWNFPGININDHIIKVYLTTHKMKGGGGSPAAGTYLEWRISESNYTNTSTATSGNFIVVAWDLLNPDWHSNAMMHHYISVESSPF